MGQGTQVDLNGAALSFTTCYHNDQDTLITYFNNSAFYPIRIKFCAGGMEECCDLITIHDGAGDFAPIVYMGNGADGDLSGVFMVGTNPDYALTLAITSNGSGSCQDENYTPLEWVVYPDLLDPQDCVFLGMAAVGTESGPILPASLVREFLDIRIPGSWSNVRVDIVDLLGRRLITTKPPSAQTFIDVSELTDGEYLAFVSGRDQAGVALRFMVVS